MLQPKNKIQKTAGWTSERNCAKGNQLAFGSFGIKAMDTKWITGRQIEAARVAVTRYMQRQGQVWIRIFLINQSLASRLTYVWVKVKVLGGLCCTGCTGTHALK